MANEDAVAGAAVSAAAPLLGSCLCGAVQWRMNFLPEGATACNCSACRRYGVLWAYDYEGHGIDVSGPTTEFRRRPESVLGFHFCGSCGCVVFWRGTRPDPDGRLRIAVNLRLTEPEQIAAVPIDHFDGLDSFDDLPRDGRCVRDYWF